MSRLSVVAGVDIDPAGVGEQAIRVDFASAWAGLALPPTCVIKPLLIGYHPRKPRHRAAYDGLVHPASPARSPLGPHRPVRHDVQSLAVHDSLPQPHSAGFSCRRYHWFESISLQC